MPFRWEIHVIPENKIERSFQYRFWLWSMFKCASSDIRVIYFLINSDQFVFAMNKLGFCSSRVVVRPLSIHWLITSASEKQWVNIERKLPISYVITFIYELLLLILFLCIFSLLPIQSNSIKSCKSPRPMITLSNPALSPNPILYPHSNRPPLPLPLPPPLLILSSFSLHDGCRALHWSSHVSDLCRWWHLEAQDRQPHRSDARIQGTVPPSHPWLLYYPVSWFWLH